jgi:hypothetical protein
VADADFALLFLQLAFQLLDHAIDGVVHVFAFLFAAHVEAFTENGDLGDVPVAL